MTGGSLLSSYVQPSKLLYHVFAGVKGTPAWPLGLSLSARAGEGWGDGRKGRAEGLVGTSAVIYRLSGPWGAKVTSKSS